MVAIGTLKRYIARGIAAPIIQTAVVLLGLYTSIDLVQEARDLEAGYGLGEMLVFIALTTPARLYDVFPYAALIGGMIGMARFAVRRELVAMRASGFDRPAILAQALAVGLAFGLGVMALGELVAPGLELTARIEREKARSGSVGSSVGRGLWVRDGPYMIRAGLMLWTEQGGVRFADVRIYRLATSDLATQASRRAGLVEILHAETARHEAGSWHFRQVHRLDPESGTLTGPDNTVGMESRLGEDVFRALATRPRLLPMHDIVEIASYLEANGQDTTAYEQALWRRALYPVNALAMLFAGLPLLFSASRRVPPGVSVFAGVSIGIAFIVVHRLVIGLAPSAPWPLWATHLVPAGLFTLLGLGFLRMR